MRDSPLLQSIRLLRNRECRIPILVFYGLVFSVVGVILLMGFSSAWQLRFMKRFHLDSDSYGEWAALQVVPSMYSFGNYVQFSKTPPDATGRLEIDLAPWVNHYPSRMLTFTMRNSDRPYWAVLTSRYRSTELMTLVKITPDEGDSGGLHWETISSERK